MLTPPEAPKPLPRWLLPYAAVLTLMAIVGTVFSAVLVNDHPEVLVALTGDAQFLVLAAPRSSFAVLFVLGVTRRAMSMVMMYVLAGHYGTRGLAWAKQRWAWLGKVEEWSLRIFGRAGTLLLIITPSHPTSAIAGMSGMTWRRYVPPMLLGQAAFTALALLTGASLSHIITPLLDWIAAHKWECTAVIATLVGLQRLYKWRSARGKRDESGSEAELIAATDNRQGAG